MDRIPFFGLIEIRDYGRIIGEAPLAVFIFVFIYFCRTLVAMRTKSQEKNAVPMRKMFFIACPPEESSDI